MHGLGQTIAAMSKDDFFLSPRSDGFSADRFDQHRATDPLRAIRSVAEVFCPHEVIQHDRSNPLDFRHSSARIESASINQISYGSEVDVLINSSNRAQYILLVQLRGQMLVERESAIKALEPGSYMLMGPDAQYRFVHERDDSHLAVGIPRRLIEQGDEAATGFGAGIDPEIIDEQAGSLIDYLGFVCRELNRGGGAFQSSIVRGGVVDSVSGMVKAMLNERMPPRPRPLAGAPGYVRRAELFMEASLADEVTIEAVASAAGVSARTLHDGFKRFRGSTPMNWLRALRLDHARRDIVAGADSSVNILAIANRYGMQHGGRFAGYYQRQFRESPSETLRSARERAAVPSASTCLGGDQPGS